MGGREELRGGGGTCGLGVEPRRARDGIEQGTSYFLSTIIREGSIVRERLQHWIHTGSVRFIAVESIHGSIF